MRSVSLADPQGPLSRRASGALSVSEYESDLSNEVFLYKESIRDQKDQQNILELSWDIAGNIARFLILQVKIKNHERNVYYLKGGLQTKDRKIDGSTYISFIL